MRPVDVETGNQPIIFDDSDSDSTGDGDISGGEGGDGRGERTTGHMLREGRVEVEEICLLVTSEWSSGMKISFPGLIVVPLSTPERTVSRLMVYERKRKG